MSFQGDVRTLVLFCPFGNAQKIVFEIITTNMIIYTSNTILDFELKRLVKQLHNSQSSSSKFHFTLVSTVFTTLHNHTSHLSPHVCFLSSFRGGNRKNVSLNNSFLSHFFCVETATNPAVRRDCLVL